MVGFKKNLSEFKREKWLGLWKISMIIMCKSFRGKCDMVCAGRKICETYYCVQ